MSTGAQQSQAGAAAATTAEAPDLLSQVIAATRPQSNAEQEKAKDYFQQFLAHAVKPGQVVSKDAELNIKNWIARIDQKGLLPDEGVDSPAPHPRSPKSGAVRHPRTTAHAARAIHTASRPSARGNASSNRT